MPPSMKYLYAKYREVAIDQLNKVNTSMLNSAQQGYINALNVSAGLMHSEQISPYVAIKMATRELVEHGLIGFYDKAGRRWEPQTAVEMIMRSNGNAVANQAVFTRMDEVGAEYITISAHLGARPKCFKDQGQIFSRRGGSGVVEDANGNKLPYRDWNTSSYGQPDGLLGINCRHHAGFFIPGKSTFEPEEIDESENAKRYKQEQKQRAYEREIRKTKRKRDIARALGDEDEAKLLDRKARFESKQLRQFIEENDLRRSKVRERPMDRAVIQKKDEAYSIKNSKSLKETVDTLAGKYDVKPMSKTNVEVRKWYIEHDKGIEDKLKRLPGDATIEDWARVAHALRNKYRTDARNMMIDQNERARLDRDFPNLTFDELLRHKEQKYNLTREEAMRDTIESASRTNKRVNRELGVEDV